MVLVIPRAAILIIHGERHVVLVVPRARRGRGEVGVCG